MNNIETIPFILPSGNRIFVETLCISGEEDVSSHQHAFSTICTAISEICGELDQALSIAAPTKATVEFGVDFGIESGQAIALVVKGSASGSLKVTLEWESQHLKKRDEKSTSN